MPKTKSKSRLKVNSPFKRFIFSNRFIVVIAIVVFAIAGSYYLMRSDAAVYGQPTTICKSARPTLKSGSSGHCVKYAQWVMATYAGQKITVDGAFGAQTVEAVKNVQSYFKLTVDGVIGTKTWDVIDMLISPIEGSVGVPGTNGSLRAACESFTINGSTTQSSFSSATEYVVVVQLKNMGSGTWPVFETQNITVTGENNYYSVPLYSTDSVVEGYSKYKNIIPNQTATITYKAKLWKGSYFPAVQGSLFDQGGYYAFGPICHYGKKITVT